MSILNEMEKHIAESVSLDNFEEISTGGGATAYFLETPAWDIMLTDEGGLDLPTNESEWVVGVYNKGGEQLAWKQVATEQEAMSVVDALSGFKGIG